MGKTDMFMAQFPSDMIENCFTKCAQVFMHYKSDRR